MRREIEIDPVERITAGAVGEPGHRVFYLQARGRDVSLTLLVEKQQVAALADQIDQFLASLEVSASGPGIVEVDTEPEAASLEEMDLEEPLVPEFRVGPMALGYDADRDRVLLQCEELVASEQGEEEPETAAEEGAVARFWATKEQMKALARHSEAVVAAGRPVCRMCGGPIDPDGHFCPASNGHREGSEPF